ncbi:Curli production assembly/transport component CsgG [Desulfosarcina cetonica]|nr:Curli production assembly/transport component CsgG [Desulfosarcina cetonica]
MGIAGRLAILILMALATGCAGTPRTPPAGPATLAVWPLADLSLPGTSQADLAELITSRVMETAQADADYTLVERERLLAVLQELSLGSSELADEATALRVGKLIGARLMLFGVYQVIGSQMRLDLRLVDVASTQVIQTAEETVPAGNLSAWLQAAETATQALLGSK